MLDRLSITIDTREQRPWAFPEHAADVSRGTIPVGDYALTGDEKNYAVERKSLDDYVGSISTTWDEFRVRFQKMRKGQWPSMVCIIEANFADTCFRDVQGVIAEPNHNHPKVSPQFIRARTCELLYYGAGIFFAGSPELAAAVCWRVLYERQCRLDGVKCEVERM